MSIFVNLSQFLPRFNLNHYLNIILLEFALWLFYAPRRLSPFQLQALGIFSKKGFRH
jgi:hypothetical protein